MAIKIPIVCVVLEGGPGTLHVSTRCCAVWGSGAAVEGGLEEAGGLKGALEGGLLDALREDW